MGRQRPAEALGMIVPAAFPSVSVLVAQGSETMLATASQPRGRHPCTVSTPTQPPACK